MRTPHAALAVVEEDKIGAYLLDPTNANNSGKAGFFFRFGFTVERCQELADALKCHAAEHEVAGIETTKHGVKYRVEGPLVTPDGRDPLVRSVWIILHGDDVPRFVTAYRIRRTQ